MKLLPLLLLICLDCGAQIGWYANITERIKISADTLPKKDIKSAGGIGSGITVTEVSDTSRVIFSDASGKLTVVEYRNIWHWVMNRLAKY